MVCTVRGDPGAAKIARDRTRTEQQIAEAIIFNEKMMVSLERKWWFLASFFPIFREILAYPLWRHATTLIFETAGPSPWR